MNISTASVSPHTVAGEKSHRRQLLRLALTIIGGGSLTTFASARAFAYEAKPVTSPATGQSSSIHQSSMAQSMRAAIKACLDCHSMCLKMATGYCLERGGRHVQQAHLRLLINCAELCQTSANFMLSDSPLHGRVCLICAEACEACAKSCDGVGDMRDCADECRRCAKSCRMMS